MHTQNNKVYGGKFSHSPKKYDFKGDVSTENETRARICKLGGATGLQISAHGTGASRKKRDGIAGTPRSYVIILILINIRYLIRNLFLQLHMFEMYILQLFMECEYNS